MMKSYCPENLVALGSTPSPPPPPNIPMADSYFGFQLKKLLLYIAFLFHMYIDMGERIAGKKHRPSLIIKGPLRAHQIATNILQITFLPLYEKLIFNCFPLLYMSNHAIIYGSVGNVYTCLVMFETKEIHDFYSCM